MRSTTGLYRDASQGGKVFRLLAIGFAVQLLSKWNANNSNYSNQARKVVTTEVNLLGWFVVWLVLTIGAEYDTTSDLAASFAMLILIAILVLDGAKAFETIQQMITKFQGIPSGDTTLPPDAAPHH